MKKLKLNIAHFSEILTREQLKQVVGGSGSGGGSGNCSILCEGSTKWESISDCLRPTAEKHCGTTVDSSTKCSCS